MPEPKKLLTTRQFATQAGLSTSTVSAWLRKGKLKGEKQEGKWMISSDELASLGAKGDSAPPTPAAAQPSSRGTASRFYSVDEFSAMTYLTAVGVVNWLKQGRLDGHRNDDGQWQVAASNLDKPDIRRLLRNP